MAPPPQEPEDTGPPPALVRPFLARGAQPPEPLPVPSELLPPARGGEPVVRAYLLTGGRVESEEIRLEYESMLSVSPRGRSVTASLAFERRQIIELCADAAQSVAEVAARLHIPIGVARVLAADLVSEGFLNLHQSTIRLSDDIAMITRLIQGVRNL